MTSPRALPAYLINGLTVALGIGVIHALCAAAAGPHAAQVALSGAVCASLADMPNPPHRTVHRVAAAALLSVLAAAVVAVLAPYPLALGLGIVAITFVAMMTMAWGPRAGAVSFAPILSVIFAMASPPGRDPVLHSIAWQLVGGAAYLAWSLASAAGLQRRYRRLALAEALAAVAALLRARAELLASTAAGEHRDDAMRHWVLADAALADKLQKARDFAFADAAATPRDAALLLLIIELRDQLLASRLDLDQLGGDRASRWLLQQMATGLRAVAGGLDGVRAGLIEGRPVAAGPSLAERLDAGFAAAPLADDDPRRRLLPAFRQRLRTLGDSVDALGAMLHGSVPPPPLTPAQLARFVAPEGWPLSALAAQWHGHSPVLRHALRAALALGSAYFIARALPWSSHPHWLVLSVAVVLRGNLEQTLGRRNARVGGTLIGCVIVIGLVSVPSAALLGGVFLLAVGTAHAFVMQRYWVTACAGTVMALLQAYAVNPVAGLAVPERIADTFLGALLAWAFSYVLPSWERRRLPAVLRAALTAIDDYAGHVLRWPAADSIEPRLARRRAYDALQALAGALQRSSAEPRRVQVPAAAVAAVLDYGQRLMAQLAVARLILSRGEDQLDGDATTAALRDALEALHRGLDPAASGSARDGSGTDGDANAEATWAMLPPADSSADLMPWLHRRLRGLVDDGRRLRAASHQALGSAPR